MTFLGWLSDPFKGLSDLPTRDEKVPLNHLEIGSFNYPIFGKQNKKSLKTSVFSQESLLSFVFSLLAFR